MVIHILFLGLIAFVPNQSGGLDALLLDTVGPQRASDGELFEEHEAFVAVTKDVAAPCASQAKHSPPTFCSWTLRHQDISFVGISISDQTVPFSKCDQSKNNCLAHIEDLDAGSMGFKEGCIEPNPTGCPLTARVVLPTTRDLKLNTRALCGPYQKSLVFHPLVNQAISLGAQVPGALPLADIVWVDATVPPNATAEIHISKFGAFGQDTIIKIKPSGADAVVVIGNLAGNMNTCDCPTEVDLHFEMFYGLAARNASIYDRVVPFACCGVPTTNKSAWLPRLRVASATDWLYDTINLFVTLPICISGVSARPICMMGSY